MMEEDRRRIHGRLRPADEPTPAERSLRIRNRASLIINALLAVILLAGLMARCTGWSWR